MYDKDHDGILSVQKLGAVLRALGHNPTEIEIQEMIDEIDSEGTYIKFVLYTINFYGVIFLADEEYLQNMYEFQNKSMAFML